MGEGGIESVESTENSPIKTAPRPPLRDIFKVEQDIPGRADQIGEDK